MVRDAGGDQLGGGVVDERHAVVADDFDLHGDALLSGPRSGGVPRVCRAVSWSASTFRLARA